VKKLSRGRRIDIDRRARLCYPPAAKPSSPALHDSGTCTARLLRHKSLAQPRVECRRFNHMQPRPRRILLSLSLLALFCFAPEARADHFTLTGTATASFNGGPFSTTAALGGLTFTGGNFAFERSALDPHSQRYIVARSVATLSYTGLNGIAFGDLLQVRLTFDPVHGASPGEMTFTFELQPYTPSNVLGISSPFVRTPITFTTGGSTIEGSLFIATFNLTPFFPSHNIGGNVVFTNASPPHPTPEPATLLLLGTGLAGVATKVYRRRRRD
jgi:hypothetical protein